MDSMSARGGCPSRELLSARDREGVRGACALPGTTGGRVSRANCEAQPLALCLDYGYRLQLAYLGPRFRAVLLRARASERWLGDAGPIHASAAAVGLPREFTASRCTTQATASLGQTRIFDVLASEACSSRARAAEFGPTRNQIRFWGLCRAKNAGLQVSNDRICQRYASLHSYETSLHAVEQPCGATTPEPGTWLSLRQQ